MIIKICSWVLLFAMQIPLVNQWGAVAYYRVNQNYIAKNLCINKDKPKMNCNGHCFLMKQLKAQQEKEEKSNQQKLEKAPEITLIFKENISITFYRGIQVSINHQFHYLDSLSFEYTLSQNKPPQSV
ncbi:hypothetical protein V7S79_09210 [Aquirufa sp. ROCK-SH2]